MVAWELGAYNARRERTCWVDRTTGPVYACKLDNEESDADANRCDEGCFRLFGGEHEDGEGELRGKELIDHNRISTLPQQS